ncbi:hypothetical protein WN943_006862 [Citrus x changshan-huyou]
MGKCCNCSFRYFHFGLSGRGSAGGLSDSTENVGQVLAISGFIDTSFDKLHFHSNVIWVQPRLIDKSVMKNVLSYIYKSVKMLVSSQLLAAMDTDELIRKCKAITIREEDKARVTLEVDLKTKKERMLAGCLMGKVLLSRGVNKEGLKAALQQVWRTFKEVKIESLGNNIFMFRFAEETDKKGYYQGIRNVPIACMEKDFLQALGGKIGIVEEVETDDNGDCFGEFARIRISVNITQPLERILFLKQEGEPDIPMPVVYERLIDFCFCCGIIGHQYKECENYQSQQKGELPYGNWMKATTQRQKQANPSRVNGSEPIEGEMGQIREDDRRSGVEGVGEQHLMKEVIESMGKKQVDGYKQAEGLGNGTGHRNVELEAGNGNRKERERVQVNQMRKEEAEIDDGLVISQLRPNKRKWKRQARSPGEGESKFQIGTQKRPRAKMSKELLMLEDMEVMESNFTEVSAEAGSQPRRKP